MSILSSHVPWQGSAHTGPALTPAEVMVAIHDIIPERDHLPLKKVGISAMVIQNDLVAIHGNPGTLGQQYKWKTLWIYIIYFGC